jgi:uncharacterized membrane protein YphA (DoxX/SURF4 family)
MRQWSPSSLSDFDDLVESPRWYKSGVLFGAAVWGSVLTTVGLAAAILIGRVVPGSAFALPGVMLAVATLVRAPWEGIREKASTGASPQPGTRTKELPGVGETTVSAGDK